MRWSRNATVATLMTTIIVAMIGLSFAAVPLYRVFCQVTGFGGTTQEAKALPGEKSDVVVTVDFNADVNPGLAWGFYPKQRSMQVKLGEENLAFFEAVNRADHPVVGRAVYNVTPFKIGTYFAKLECFCFTEQTLAAGEKVEMPVSFFVDPSMMKDADASEVRQITLSYTFFIDEEATAALAKKTVKPVS